MTQYRVLWDEDIEADSPVEAAFKARELIAGPITSTHIFTVWGDLGEGWCVDLQDHTATGPIVPDHQHNFVGDEDTCTVYRECPLTWREWRAHQARKKEAKQ